MKLTVLHNSTNYTLKMDDLTAAAKPLDLSSGEILLGFHKPLSAFYVELTETSPGTVPTLDLKYYNGTTFAAVPGVEDRTFGLTKCGLISWNNEDLTEEESTQSSISDLYWYKLTTSVPASVAIKGINLILSNDKDLLSFIPSMMTFLPSGLTNFVGFHQEARNIVIQNIRNSGKKIKGCADLVSKQVDVFDLLDVEEFRQASKYLALHLIFDHISKGEDDLYATRAQKYHNRYLDSVNSRLISIDENQDGKKDESETGALSSTKIVRV